MRNVIFIVWHPYLIKIEVFKIIFDFSLRLSTLAGRGWSKELLAREVLAEIPDQLLSYMKSKGFQPPNLTAATGQLNRA
jgi:hypothetical protein